jgi:hypothetical protein
MLSTMEIVPMRGYACLLVLAVACSQTEPTTPVVDEWSIDPMPAVSIGVAEGDENYMFRRVVGALLLRDGRVAVADVAPALTIYDSTGKFVRRVGGAGRGPGEFVRLFTAPMRYRGDSLLIWDIQAQRASIFSDDGQFGRSYQLNIPMRFWPPGTIPDQSCCIFRAVLGDSQPILEYPAAIPNHPGADRVSKSTIVRVKPDGVFADTIGSFDGRWYRYDATKPNFIAGLHESRQFTYVVVGDTLFGGNGDGAWLLRVLPDGTRDTIRLAMKTIPVTDSIKKAIADGYRAEFKRSPERFEGSVESLFEGKYVSHLPAYTRLHSDGAGHLWLAQWKIPYSQDSTRFDVYSTSGNHVARIAIPSGARILDLKRDRVVMLTADSLGIESVRVHRIVRRP